MHLPAAVCQTVMIAMLSNKICVEKCARFGDHLLVVCQTFIKPARFLKEKPEYTGKCVLVQCPLWGDPKGSSCANLCHVPKRLFPEVESVPHVLPTSL